MKSLGFVLLNFFLIPFSYGQIENIITDSQTYYFNDVVSTDEGYVFGGTKGSCRASKIWMVDSGAQELVDEIDLFWPQNGFGTVLEMKKTDTGIHVLTIQALADDVGAPQLVWYLMDNDLSKKDSINFGDNSIPYYQSIKDLYFLGNSILYKTSDTLYHRILEHNVLFSTPIDASNRDLVPLLYDIYTFQDSLIVSYKSNLTSDTMVMDHPIRDLTSTGCFEQEVDSAGILFALTDSLILCFKDSTWEEFPIAQSLDKIHWDPVRDQVVGIDTLNNFYLYDIDSFSVTDSVSLFYRPYYDEKLSWRPLSDGNWGRIGTTRVNFETLDPEKYGTTTSQEFGFYQFFDPDRPEEISLDRPDLSMDSVWLIDSFYLGDPQVMDGDTAYYKNNDSGKIGISVNNKGVNTITTFTSGSDLIFGVSCAHLFNFKNHPVQIQPQVPSESVEMELQPEPFATSTNQTNKLAIYSGFPNKRYDANFEDNIDLLIHGYIMTGVNNLPIIKSTDLRVFPNPSSGDINIEWGGNQPLTAIELINSSGKVVRNVPLEGPVRSTSIHPQVSPGLYFLKIYTPEGYIVKKVLFSH